MMIGRLQAFRRVIALALFIGVTACATSADRPRATGQPGNDATRVVAPPQHADFSGSWELDYTRSDNVNERLKKLFRGLNRSAQARASRNGGSRNVNIGNTAMAESIIALARLADSIVRSQVLEIVQVTDSINITREDDYALACTLHDGTPKLTETSFGTELCGWSGEQMVFHVSLPGGLTINHRLSLAADKQRLHVTTTVASTSAPVPFSLSQFYNRFEPLESAFECHYTLSKHRVCSLRETDP